MIPLFPDTGLNNSSVEMGGEKVPEQTCSAGYNCKLGEECLESSSVGSNLGVQVSSSSV